MEQEAKVGDTREMCPAEMQQIITQARMKLNHIKVQMRRTKDESVWLGLATVHAEITAIRNNLMARLRERS